MKKSFDYIICGAGASGLLLANAMIEDKFFRDKKILLIEKIENQLMIGHGDYGTIKQMY